MSSVTGHQFLSEELLDIPSASPFLCERKAGLDPGNCFKIYGTLKNYKMQQ